MSDLRFTMPRRAVPDSVLGVLTLHRTYGEWRKPTYVSVCSGCTWTGPLTAEAQAQHQADMIAALSEHEPWCMLPREHAGSCPPS